jgi:hypothetical protein
MWFVGGSVRRWDLIAEYVMGADGVQTPCWTHSLLIQRQILDDLDLHVMLGSVRLLK